MNVKDVMTTEVLTVSPETSLKDVARLLSEHRISGLPVVDERGAVVGVVSEGDVLFKEGGPDSRGPLPWRLDPRGTAHRAKLAARTAGDAMTSPAVTVQEWRTVASAAKVMLDERVNRLPVVEHDRLVGIVTRADLVRAFARSDDTIRDEIRDRVLRSVLMLRNPELVEVTVVDGQVALSGSVDTPVEAQIAADVTARVPGVVGVSSSLGWSRAGEER
jgi:CBS domain-containing protein